MDINKIIKTIANVVFWPVPAAKKVYKSEKLNAKSKIVLYALITYGLLAYISIFAVLIKGPKNNKQQADEQPAASESAVETVSDTEVTVPEVTELLCDNTLMNKNFEVYEYNNKKFYSITLNSSEITGLTTDNFKEFESRIPDDAETTTIICNNRGFRFPNRNGIFKMNNYFEYGTLSGDKDNSLGISHCAVYYDSNSFEIKIEKREEDDTDLFETTIGLYKIIDDAMINQMNESKYHK